MPVLTIALMGFLAFNGGPQAPVEAVHSAPVEAEVVTTLARKDATPIVRADGTDAYTVKLTSYNAVPEQTDANPHETASGAFSNPEVVAARSVDLREELPFGTVIKLERSQSDTNTCRFEAVEHLIGYRVVADSMHSRKRAQIDVLLSPEDTVTVHGKQVNPSIALGICGEVTATVVGRIRVADIPETQEELRLVIEGDALALR